MKIKNLSDRHTYAIGTVLVKPNEVVEIPEIPHAIQTLIEAKEFELVETEAVVEVKKARK